MPTKLLSEVAAGQTVRLAGVDGGRHLTRRLLALGLCIGSEVRVLHRRGDGVVVARDGNRVALGKHIVEKLRAEALE